ncbi:hypothetical protein HZS_6854 [Henneguya salminicola]|nr:hypothetical protein HZS_6854 [Henneguya salminicola]
MLSEESKVSGNRNTSQPNPSTIFSQNNAEKTTWNLNVKFENNVSMSDKIEKKDTNKWFLALVFVEKDILMLDRMKQQSYILGNFQLHV